MKIKISVFVTLSLLALICYQGGAQARADDEPHASPSSHWNNWSLILSPRYYRLKEINVSPAFTNNGFEARSKDRAGFGLGFTWTGPSAWQFGVGFGTLAAYQTIATSEAFYTDQYWGFTIGRNLTAGTDWDVTVASLVGLGNSTVQILSPNQNGRFSESSLVVEPSLGAAYRISHSVKLGVSVSYLFPFARATEIKGQDLGVSNISVQGWSVGLNLILGYFGNTGSKRWSPPFG